MGYHLNILGKVYSTRYHEAVEKIQVALHMRVKEGFMTYYLKETGCIKLYIIEFIYRMS